MAQGADAEIKRLLRASNHFDMLRLRRPHADLMDQPVWEVSGDEVHRAFRKLSLCCHPDKSSHPDAPRAFEELKKAKACLSDALTREDYLIEFIKRQKTSWEGNWTSAESAGESKQRVSSMREEAQRTEADNVVDAMRERREKAEAAERKRQRVQAAQQRRKAADASQSHTTSGGALDDDDSDDDAKPPGGGSRVGSSSSGAARPAGGPAARKRPKFL